MGEQIDSERVRPELGVKLRAGAIDHCPHHFVTGGIAQRVNNAAMAVPALAAQHQFAVFAVEVCAPLDQLLDMPRRLADDHFHHVAVAQIGAGRERILDVVVERVLRVEHARDAALCIRAVGLLHRELGNHQERQPRVDFHRGPQAGNPAADNEHVDEVVRNPLGMKRHQISRHFAGHSGS